MATVAPPHAYWIGNDAPADRGAEIGFLWYDVALGLLKVCTSLAPDTFTALGSAAVDHGGLLDLGADDHLQYLLLAGRAGGQVAYGGTAANDDLSLEGTSHGTKTTSYVILQPTSGNVGIGTSTPEQKLHLLDGFVLVQKTGVNRKVYFGYDLNPGNDFSVRAQVDGLSFDTNSSSRYRISVAGKHFWNTSTGATGYPGGVDYEGLTLTMAAGSATFAAETAGTGTDNISIIFNPAGTGSLKWGANTVAVLPLTFARGGTVTNSTGVATGNYIVWYAPFACTVTNVRGYRVGGTGATVNARLNGASNHLAAAVSLVAADTWTDGGAVQNTAYVAGDKLEVMVVSVAGAPTQIAVQVDFTRP